MQQTQKYQLNKIDMDDTFSPEPLNENMDKVEAELTALGGADTALEQRIAVLEAHKIAVGSYNGTGASSRIINLGFTPRVVFIQPQNDKASIVTRDYSYLYGAISITENGFKAGVSASGNYGMNNNNTAYLYCAIS